MRKRYVSKEELEKIFSLKQSGASWLKIQRDSGIPRRTAKRAFEEYEHSKSSEELKAARQQVASVQFNYHMGDLIALAQLLVLRIDDPAFRDMREANCVIDDTLSTDIRTHKVKLPFRPQSGTATPMTIRQNTILLESLKAHTHEKISWQVLEDWKIARNKWIHSLNQLISDAAVVVSNIINQELQSKDSSMIDKVGEDGIDHLKEGVVEAIYNAMTDNRLSEADSYIRLIQNEDQVFIVFSKGRDIIRIRVQDIVVGERLIRLAGWAVKNLSTGKESTNAREMAQALNTMREKRVELEDLLDELKLIPLILKTRCEICPV